MICANGIDLLNGVRECRSFVDDQLQELMSGCSACEKCEFAVYGTAPRGYDSQTNLKGRDTSARWVRGRGKTYDYRPHGIKP